MRLIDFMKVKLSLGMLCRVTKKWMHAMLVLYWMDILNGEEQYIRCYTSLQQATSIVAVKNRHFQNPNHKIFSVMAHMTVAEKAVTRGSNDDHVAVQGRLYITMSKLQGSRHLLGALCSGGQEHHKTFPFFVLLKILASQK